MITCAKVLGVDKRWWIKATFPYCDEYVQAVKRVPHSLYVRDAQAWAIPWEMKAQFDRSTNDFIVIWNSTEHSPSDMIGGGIPEETLSIQSMIPGYSITYDGDKIVDYTGFTAAPYRSYQVQGVNALVQNRFLILADDAGLGKTYTLISAVESLSKTGDVHKGLIVAKSSLLYNWLTEIEKFSRLKAVVMAGNANTRHQIIKEFATDENQILIMSYDTYRRDLEHLKKLNKRRVLDFCALDEAHVALNPDSQIGKAIHAIPFRRKYVLTATPFKNHPLELYNFLKWGGLTDDNPYQFRRRYGILGGFQNKQIIGVKRVHELKEMINRCMLRRLKRDKLDLPPITFKQVKLKMTAEQQRMYGIIRGEIMAELENPAFEMPSNPLTVLMRLQQVSASLDLLGEPASPSNSVKVDKLIELVKEITQRGEKAIIFSKFRSMVDLVAEKLANYSPAVIHGDVDAQGLTEAQAQRKAKKTGEDAELLMASERQREVNRFNNDPACKVAVLSGAGREGLNMQSGTHCIFLDHFWTFADYEQQYSRIYRIGQSKPVTVWDFICEGTIDEHVYDIVMSKKSVSEFMLDKQRSLGDVIQFML